MYVIDHLKKTYNRCMIDVGVNLCSTSSNAYLAIKQFAP